MSKKDDKQHDEDIVVDDDVVSDASPGSEQDFDKLKQEFEEMQEQFSAMQNQLKRAVADYQNLEKRVVEGRTEWATWAGAELIQKILPSVDHLEKALAGATDEEKKSGWFRGTELSLKQLKETLKSEGLEQIVADPSTLLGTGSQFDPSLHEAVDTRDGEHDKILEVLDNGYLLNGKVLRPARVVVGRKQ